LVQVENSLSRVQERKGDQFVLVQKCFRHFDLDKVGTDDIHLSLFEMPGAFVFGPDGKAGTVQRMYTLATSVLGIDKNKIWASYFMGGKVQNNHLLEDTITRQTWLEVGISENHAIGLGPENNYWMQGKGIDGNGATRKCGPNTELFFDRGEDKSCGVNCKPGCKCGRFVEFSNSLFICSEMNEENGALYPIANPFTETVIGTERVAMIRQGVQSVFDTEEYRPVIETIHRFVRVKDLPEALISSSECVIADHLKALYILIADGAPPPGKDGRQRIVKMLIRKVITRQMILGIESEHFIPAVLESIWRAIQNDPAFEDSREKIMLYFSSEKHRFLKTIERGSHRLLKLLKENNDRTLSGIQIVCLEKECGLPHLLTAMELRKKGLGFAVLEYNDALNAVEGLQSNYNDTERRVRV